MKIVKKLWVVALCVCLVSGVFAACKPQNKNHETVRYTVTYDANGGTLTGDASVTVDKGVSVTLPAAVRDGYDLTGWSDGAATVGTAGAGYTPTADVTLSAVWNAVEPDDPSAEYAAENLERAIAYAKLIHAQYWNSANCTSSLIPGAGTPFLWPYTEQAAMVNGILGAIDETHADYAFFKTYLEEVLEGLRYYRVATATPGSGESWNNAAHRLTQYGENDGTADQYAIYQAGRQSVKDSANASFGGIYFDDNIWVAKEFYEAYENLGDVKYLNEAMSIVNWIVGEGYETTAGMSGIYWNWGAKFKHPGVTDDSKNASLNACSTAPTAMMLVKLYNATADSALEGKFDAIRANYRAVAIKLYNFVWKELRDPDRNVIRDKIFVNKDGDELVLGTLDQQELPYNTGTYMTAGAELYNLMAAEGASSANVYKERNAQIAAGADAYFANSFVVEGQYAYNKNSWFTSFLITGYRDILPTDPACETYIDRMRSSLDYGWKNNRDENGFVCPAWVEGWSAFDDNGVSEGNPRQILLQSANAHCYAMLAQHYAAK